MGLIKNLLLPICEVALPLTVLRSSRQSGPDLLNLSSSQFDPEPAFDRPHSVLRRPFVPVHRTVLSVFDPQCPNSNCEVSKVNVWARNLGEKGALYLHHRPRLRP